MASEGQNVCGTYERDLCVESQSLSGNYFQFNLKAVIIDGRSQWPRGLRRRYVAHRGHGCLSVVSVVCCQVEISATS